MYEVVIRDIEQNTEQVSEAVPYEAAVKMFDQIMETKPAQEERVVIRKAVSHV